MAIMSRRLGVGKLSNLLYCSTASSVESLETKSDAGHVR